MKRRKKYNKLTAKKRKNIYLINKQKKLLQIQKNKLAKQLASAGVRGEIRRLKAQRLALSRQTRELKLAKLRKFQKGVKKLHIQKRAKSFLRALERL